MTDLFLRFFSLSVTFCVISLIILLFFGAFGKRFSAKCRYIVWSMLVLRLLIPIGGVSTPLFNITIPTERPNVTHIEVSESIETVGFGETADIREPLEDSEEKAPNFTPPATVQTDSAGVNSEPIISIPTESLPLPTVPSPESFPVYIPEEIETNPPQGVISDAVHSENAELVVPAESQIGEVKPDSSVNSEVTLENERKKHTITLPEILDILTAVWIFGSVACLSFKLWAYISYSCALKRSGTLVEPTDNVREIYDRVVADLGIKHAPRLLVSSESVSPMLVGYFKPTVILSEISVPNDGLYRIIMHELTHYLRGDLWMKLASAVAESLYWFNPMVRFITVKCAGEMELSCDEATLAGLGEAERVTYGEAVLAIMKSGRKQNRLTTSFSSDGKTVKKRFEGIIDGSLKRRGKGVVAIVLVMCILSGSLFACAEEKNSETAKESEQTASETEKNEDNSGSEESDGKETTNEKENPEDDDETENNDIPVQLEALKYPAYIVKAYDCRDAYHDKPHLSSYGHEVNYRVAFADDIEGYDVAVCKIRVCDDGCSDGDIVGAALSGNARAYDLEYLYELPAEGTNHPIKVFKWSLPEAMYDEYPNGENDSEISDDFRSTMYLVNVSENVRLVLRLDPKEDTPRAENERELMDKLVSGIDVRDTAHSEGKHHRYEVYVHKRSNVYIYDSDGNIVYEEYNDLSNVSVEETDGLVVIKKGLGNGPVETKYYSTEKNIICDDYYYDVAAYDDGKIIYADGSSGIVIKSIFDSSVYHYIEDRLDIKWRLWCIKNAYFEDGKAVVEYRYFEAEDSEESSVKTVVVELSKEDTNPECVHSYVKQSEIPATCGEDGSIRYACGICGAEAAYTEVLPKTGHRANDATCTTPSVCVDCGMWFAPEKGHDFTAATVDSPMRCKICGVSVGEPVVPINIDTESFKNVSDYVWNTAIPKCSNLSIYVKDGYYDLETRMYREAEILTAVRIDDVKYSSQSISDTEKYKVTFYFSGEVIRDETDTDTSYLTMVIFDKQTMEEMIYTVPYSDFSMGDAVQVELSAELKSGNYRIYFANGSKYSAIYN